MLASLTQTLLGLLLSLIAIFMILLILVQRGRGGGLAGALGGMGGSSAFGAKAGDVFTRITGVSAFVWILLCIVMAKWGGAASSSRLDVPNRANAPTDNAAVTAEKEPGGDAATAPATNGAEPAPASASGPAPPASGPATPPANPGPPAQQ
ncbi:MAG: preprotein translocase subunit SecG [Pirellulales bacterium]|nr:preprotein translocase subunit SecG [Pirellulales bacterium]